MLLTPRGVTRWRQAGREKRAVVTATMSGTLTENPVRRRFTKWHEGAPKHLPRLVTGHRLKGHGLHRPREISGAVPALLQVSGVRLRWPPGGLRFG